MILQVMFYQYLVELWRFSFSTQAQQISPRHINKYEGLSGPQYQLNNKPLKYNLPPPKNLRVRPKFQLWEKQIKLLKLNHPLSSSFQPYQDTQAGGLDTWPAHSTPGANGGVALTRSKHLLVMDSANQQHGQPPKPRFLSQLESFLNKELKALGVSQVQPSELRLQVKYLCCISKTVLSYCYSHCQMKYCII